MTSGFGSHLYKSPIEVLARQLDSFSEAAKIANALLSWGDDSDKVRTALSPFILPEPVDELEGSLRKAMNEAGLEIVFSPIAGQEKNEALAELAIIVRGLKLERTNQ